jgi:uncharacterized SAM-binding protein YcdF (DUF218 family)
MAGLELASRLGPDCKLVFSGSAGRSQPEIRTALVMRDMTALVEPERRVDAEAESSNTGEHPGNVRPFVGDRPFALVTSANHMPRAMRIFRSAGLDPVAYPVDYLAGGVSYSVYDLIPSADSLWADQVALREYLALAYYYFKTP